jgi:hypothetical protein
MTSTPKKSDRKITVKPDGGSQDRGIYLVQDFEGISESAVVQVYLIPFLLCKKQRSPFWEGGQDNIKPLWKHYFEGAEGVIFVVDSSDRTVLEKANKNLHEIAQALQLKSCPIRVFANKQVLDATHSHMEANCDVTCVGLAEEMN